VKRLCYAAFLLAFMLPMMAMSAAVSYLRWAEKRLYLWQRDHKES